MLSSGSQEILKVKISVTSTVHMDSIINNTVCLFLVEVQSPSLGVPANPSQVDQPDQLHIWFLQLDIFFDKFFQAADHLEMIKRAQEKKS